MKLLTRFTLFFLIFSIYFQALGAANGQGAEREFKAGVPDQSATTLSLPTPQPPGKPPLHKSPRKDLFGSPDVDLKHNESMHVEVQTPEALNTSGRPRSNTTPTALPTQPPLGALISEGDHKRSASAPLPSKKVLGFKVTDRFLDMLGRFVASDSYRALEQAVNETINALRNDEALQKVAGFQEDMKERFETWDQEHQRFQAWDWEKVSSEERTRQSKKIYADDLPAELYTGKDKQVNESRFFVQLFSKYLEKPKTKFSIKNLLSSSPKQAEDPLKEARDHFYQEAKQFYETYAGAFNRGETVVFNWNVGWEKYVFVPLAWEYAERLVRVMSKYTDKLSTDKLDDFKKFIIPLGQIVQLLQASQSDFAGIPVDQHPQVNQYQWTIEIHPDLVVARQP